MPGGSLIDLRPFHSNPPIEVLAANDSFVAGHVNDEGGAPDDVAADGAIDETLRRGFFTLEKEDPFMFAFYWDTLESLLDYASEKWRDFAYVPSPVIDRAQRYIKGINPPYQVRIRRPIHLAIYEKQTPDRPKRRQT